MAAGHSPENETTRSTAATGNGSTANDQMGSDMFDQSEGTARPDGPAAELTPQFIEAILTPDTLTPAPCALDWCDLGGVHDYTSHPMRPGDGLERFHERTLKGDSPLTVMVSALEQLDDEGVALGAPTIGIEDPDGREFTATEARGLAAALLVAAAVLDEMGGA